MTHLARVDRTNGVAEVRIVCPRKGLLSARLTFYRLTRDQQLDLEQRVASYCPHCPTP